MVFKPSSEIQKTQSLPPRLGEIVVVSGLPRSGTSMMMSMLEAGGLQVVTDRLRQADESNPKGYYEFERVKKLKEGDFDWLNEAQGKVVKVVSALLEYLPGQYSYRIVFMRRAMDEILASQKEMLHKRGEDTQAVSDQKMRAVYEKHLAKIEGWLSLQKNLDVQFISYNELLDQSEGPIKAINAFFGDRLDAALMKQVIDGKLYRQRAG